MFSKKSLLPLISIIVLFTIVCIIVFARGSLNTNDEIETSMLLPSEEISESKSMNEIEKDILNMLKDGMERQNISEDMINDPQSMYITYLEGYFNNPDISLSKEKSYEIVNLIKSLNRIMIIEKEHDLKQMSIDGRGVAISICEHIYQLCGLKIIYSIEGNIVQITDSSGKYLYSKNNNLINGNFSIYAFVIVVFIWISLFIICSFLTRKNQLFIRTRSLYLRNQSVKDSLAQTNSGVRY